jgi:hypothetical protein
MKTITSSIELACTPDTFWRVYLDPAYLRALYLDALGYNAFEVMDAAGDARKIRIVPKLNLPGPLQKLVGARNEWQFRMVQPDKLDPGAKAKKDMISTQGTIRVEAVGSDRCRRNDEVVIEANVFGLGGLIEGAAEKETRAARDKEYAFLKQWIAKG